VAGEIDATVSVAQSPEPASLLLAGLGAAGGGLFRWRRRWAAS
jgi:hypothetical protein